MEEKKENETERKQTDVRLSYSGITKKEFGYFGRPSQNWRKWGKGNKGKNLETQILMRGRGRLYPERVCYSDHHVDLRLEKKRLRQKLKRMNIIK